MSTNKGTRGPSTRRYSEEQKRVLELRVGSHRPHKVSG